MDRPTIANEFIFKMRSQKEERRRRELEEKVQSETRARRAYEDGIAAGMAAAQRAASYEDLKALSERYTDYLNPEFMPHDRERLKSEWFSFKDWTPSPEPDAERWRCGFCEGVVNVFRVIDKE